MQMLVDSAFSGTIQRIMLGMNPFNSWQLRDAVAPGVVRWDVASEGMLLGDAARECY